MAATVAPLKAQNTSSVQTVATGVSPLFGKINPFYGDINASSGKINPFFGKINPFFGKINPFFGDVTGFWGKINPFTQTADSALLTFYGNSDPFWGSVNPYGSSGKAPGYAALNGFWSDQFTKWAGVMTAWSTAQTAADRANLTTMIQDGLVAPSSKFWNNAVTKSNSKTTAAALINGQLAAAGITFNNDGTINGASLIAISPTQQALLFLNIYDSLMDYSGTGHVDWWMGSVHWSPALAEIDGAVPKGGTAPTIGMIDFVLAQGKNVPKQVTQYGSTVFNDGHGAAVGSLIIGATDGSGVLGVLPAGAANVKVYNPYDDSGTTNWTDVGTGVATLVKAVFISKTTPVGVLNASLGVPGWALNPGWNDALANAGAHGHNLVIAAGNDGVVQTQNVPWNFDANPTLLIVGSVGADGTISNFSNTPGEACLLPTGSASTNCVESNKLKYRFVVAPGELILVSDGMGSHYRQSGTSLAAPLVSGAIAMLQNRWPWLSNYPEETASIILKSATPLGSNPGADPVYGAGELNVAAAQSPLDWASAVYFPAYNGKLPSSLNVAGVGASWSVIAGAGQSLGTVLTQIGNGTQSSWDASGLSFTVAERVGNTFRDFYVPLSAKLVGQNVTTLGGGQAYQSYLSTALRAQASHFAGLEAGDPASGPFTNGFERSAAPAGMIGSMQLRVRVTPTAPVAGFRSTSTSLFETGGALVGERGTVVFGYGSGAAALDSGAIFTFRSDHDLGTGGANPILGLASGGAYLGGRWTVLSRLSIGFGTTQRNAWRNPLAFGLGAAPMGSWASRYAAAAQTMTADYAVSPRLVARSSFTHLREQSALLGIQSLDRADLQGGSATDAATLGFDLRLSHGLTLSGSGTVARTYAHGGQITTSNLTGMSAELGFAKNGVLGRHDQLRLIAATPLHTVAGGLNYTSVAVVDRQTGELGLVTQSIAPRSGSLPLTGEVLYGRHLTDGKGEVSLFGRIERTNQLSHDDPLGTMGGVQLQLAF